MLLKIIKRAVKFFTTSKSQKPSPVKIPYPIEHEQLSPYGLKVIARLQQHGYEAYFVGGCLRDILLSQRPKDFDVVTSATPEQIKKIFANAIIIGRRFTLVHVRFRNELIEVATFRQQHHALLEDAHGVITDDNNYGTLEDDVMRRDFTINALYYDPFEQTITDYVGGLQDAQDRVLRTIGEDELLFAEDPVRMIRAIRYASKLNLTLTTKIKDAIAEKSGMLLHVPKARLFEEVMKCFSQSCASQILSIMLKLNVARYLVPKNLLSRTRRKQVFLLLSALSKRNPMKEHLSALIFLCFIGPSLKGLAGPKLADALIHAIKEFQDLVLLPKQVEYSLRSVILNEKISDHLPHHRVSTPDLKNLKVHAQELLALL